MELKNRGEIMKIELEVVKSLAKNLNKYNLSELTFESEGEKLTLKKEIPQESVAVQVVQQKQVQHVEAQVSEVAEKVASVPVNDDRETIKSPMVGTFYRSPSPDAAPFVEIGQEVKEGDVLCIVEAMKLMNEVRATKRCKIEEILPVDGKVLQKGESIFVIS